MTDLLGAIQRYSAWHDKWEPYMGLAVHYLAFIVGVWIVLSPAPWMPDAAIYSVNDTEVLAWTWGLMLVLLSRAGREYNKKRVFGG